jgi:2',5'-phosphodiesterase
LVTDEQEAVVDLDVSHSLQLISACGTPEYTNFTPDFQGCLDYIYVDRNQLKVDRVVPLIEHEEIIAGTAIPNERFPSDHLALVCDISYAK